MFGQLLKLLLLAVVTIWAAVAALPDKNLHVVFCDVGQGDAVLVKMGTSQVLVDGGPDNKVLECLARNMPFYDRRIEVVILTHPQADHMNGLVDVLERYTVLRFISGPEGNGTASFRELMGLVSSSQSQVSNLYAGEEVKIDDIRFRAIWPTREYVERHVDGISKSLNGSVLGAKTDGTDLNSFGIVVRLAYGEFDVLLTGDADVEVQDDQMRQGLVAEVEVLKVPHHGSKNGMDETWLSVVSPEAAVISVGKNNRYGHPRSEALKMLEDAGARIMRTDVEGEIEVVSDGKRWWVE